MAETASRRAQIEESIEEARRVLTAHYDYLKGNETRTRALVIDDVLTALGWDIKDPALVWLEERANGNWMDYVLRSSSEVPLAVVEAKPVGSGAKDADRRQASGYAAEIGAPYTVLTNGGRWEAWEIVPGTPRKNSTFVEVHLATGDIPKLAAELEKLSQGVLGQRET
ncbi:MAG: hypothetical protein F4Y07_09925 [Gemmatimonadetes bacterium]|nr:hypothetical protein [Gemmatimonadota bacterium]MYE16782.1 hypothetical protein [Gemmatimonadota bacterium]